MDTLNYRAMVLGLIRDVDNALPCEIIARRMALDEDSLTTVIDSLLQEGLIRTFPDDMEKPPGERRLFARQESLEQIRSLVRDYMSELSNEGRLYFAYGTNMHPEQMYQQRCPGSHFLMRGEIHDRRLVFQHRSEQWGGGVAGMVYSEGDSVWGAAFWVSDRHWAELDRLEGKPAGYRRIRVPVRTHFGIFCMESYNTVPGDECLPSSRYMAHIIEGAEFFGLPQQYIKRLKNTPYLGARQK